MTYAPLPLVCIGGTLCDERLFAPMLERLGRAADVWLPNMHDRIDAAATALLDSVPGPFVALGFSLGGFVAIEALRQCPDRVRGLVLVSGNAFPDDPTNAIARRADVAAGRELGLHNWMISRTALLCANQLAHSVTMMTILAEMAAGQGDDVHARQAELNIHRPDLRAVVSAANVPMLAIAGSSDRLCPAERYLELAHSANMRLVIIGGAGHFLPLEKPDRCADFIRTYLIGNGL